jgi:hypothetical protein
MDYHLRLPARLGEKILTEAREANLPLAEYVRRKLDAEPTVTTTSGPVTAKVQHGTGTSGRR